MDVEDGLISLEEEAMSAPIKLRLSVGTQFKQV